MKRAMLRSMANLNNELHKNVNIYSHIAYLTLKFYRYNGQNIGMIRSKKIDGIEFSGTKTIFNELLSGIIILGRYR